MSMNSLTSRNRGKKLLWPPTKKLVFLALFVVAVQSVISLFLGFTLSECDDDPGRKSSPGVLDAITSVSTALAYRESYGFFDDITDSSWMLMKQRAQRTHSLVVKDHRLAPEANQESPTEWYRNDLQPDFICPHMSLVGGQGDGAMWTCDPHRLIKRTDCVIYSVGSDGVFDFEDGIVDLLGSKHCEIHVFDTIDQERVGDPELRNIFFHKWGIHSSYDEVYNAEMVRDGLEGLKPEFDSLPHTMKDRFLEENRTIDILKIDCDGCEWTTYKDLFKVDVRQVLVKTHSAPYTVSGNEWHTQMMAAQFFDDFTANNFAIFSITRQGDSMEFGFIKVQAAFWKRDGKRFSVDRQTTLQLRSLPDVFAPVSPPAPFKIPRMLVFVSEEVVTQTEDPVESFFNVQRTIDLYKEAWKDPLVPVWFLDDLTCLAAIYKAKKELVSVYRAETDTAKRIDMCQIAALYLSGGYYFEVNFEVSVPVYTAADNVGLTIGVERNDFSKRFLASEPKNAVLKTTLQKMLDLTRLKRFEPEFDLVLEAFARATRNPGEAVAAVVLPLKDVGGNISTPWIVTETSVENFDNPVPTNMRGVSSVYNIPRRLIFTHKDSLLETKDPPVLYDNVQKTIEKYRQAWGDPDAPVWFLNDTDCRAAVYATKPDLLTYFDREPHGSWKADICRVAALYLTGGYYFDVDMEVVDPWMHDIDVTFATVMNPDKTRYFQSFLASEKGGRIMGEALDEMLLFYEDRKTRRKTLIGPNTLKWAVESVPILERGRMVILEEVQLTDSDTPLRPNAVGCCCNLVVQEPVTNRTLFYSRVVDAGYKCVARGSPLGITYLAKEAFKTK